VASDLSGCAIAGALALGPRQDDRLLTAPPTQGNADSLLVTAQGRAIRIQEETVRPQGASAAGMRGITLKPDDSLVAADVVRERGELLVATALGYAKRTALSEFPTQGRGGAGVVVADPAKAKLTGALVAACVVFPDDQVALVTSDGCAHRLAVGDVPRLERASWGRLVSASRRYAVVPVKAETVVRCLRLEGVAPAGGKPKSGAPSRSPRTRTAPAGVAIPAPEPQEAPTPVSGRKPSRKSETASHDEPAPPSAETPTPAPVQPPAKAADAAASEATPAPAATARTRRTTASTPPQRRPAHKGEP